MVILTASALAMFSTVNKFKGYNMGNWYFPSYDSPDSMYRGLVIKVELCTQYT